MNQDLEQYFRDEAQDLLLRINNALRASQHHGSRTDALQEVRRCVHTLKGSAHIAERRDVAQRAHELEDLIDQVALGSDLDDGISKIIHFTDQMAELLSPGTANPNDRTPVENGDNRPPSSQPLETIHVELRQIDRILNQANTTGGILIALQSSLSFCEKVKDLLEQLTDLQNTKTSSVPLQRERTNEIRLQVSALARSIELASEAFERNQQSLRRTVEDLRLVPAREVFIFMERAVRAAAEATGKQVEFETAGGEIELDADILFQIKDALVQMARNAVAHGIEDVTTRRAAGKSATGKIRLTVARRGRRITFSVEDDGVGIDSKKLRERAVERGWLSRKAAEEADTKQLSSMILRPGFTTSAAVTAVAGRGVGLDLVRDMVARLKGEIRIDSEQGRGTRIEVEVPITVTSISVLRAGVDSVNIGVPTDSVGGIYPLSKLRRVNDAFIVDDAAMPLLPLAPLLRAERTHPKFGIKIASNEPYLLGVDSVIGIQESTIHQLPSFMAAEPYILGISIESAESARLIIDPIILRDTSESTPGFREPESAPALPILVVDDSLTTRILEQSILTTAGYQVELAISAEEALQLAKNRRFGLFVVDIEMPGMDGFAFVARTQESPALRNIPSILVTSRNSTEDRRRGVEVGAKDYFSKATFDQKALLLRIGELMGRR